MCILFDAMGLGLCLFLYALCGILFLQGPALAAGPVELYLIPHTHADVGWLQTLDSLSRVNVSRILDGVVGNLLNDTAKRRRFVWDEMAFLQLWWDNQATAAQQEAFAAFVRDGRVELVDNGWSQHDMGCTTVDSMLNNWVGTCYPFLCFQKERESVCLREYVSSFSEQDVHDIPICFASLTPPPFPHNAHISHPPPNYPVLATTLSV